MWGLGFRVRGLGLRVEPCLRGREGVHDESRACERGLVFKAHRLLYHSTLWLECDKEEEEESARGP